jgi:hypothetical protein
VTKPTSGNEETEQDSERQKWNQDSNRWTPLELRDQKSNTGGRKNESGSGFCWRTSGADLSAYGTRRKTHRTKNSDPAKIKRKNEQHKMQK